MPNPSTIAEHFQTELEEQRAILADPRLPKQDKERALRRVRSIEDTLGLPSEPYNGRPAGPRADTVTISREALGQLLDAADSYLNDLETGLEDGTYEDDANSAELVAATGEARAALGY